MDTADKAAGWADAELTDAINRDWLLVSGQSSQLSGELRRRQLEAAIDWPSEYELSEGESCLEADEHHEDDYENLEASELARGRPSYGTLAGPALWGAGRAPISGPQHAIAIYDNIGLAEAPGLFASHSFPAGKEEMEKKNKKRKGGPLFAYGQDWAQAAEQWREWALGRRATGKRRALRAYAGRLVRKFRLLLAAYLLLGLTLTIYSRNALSLAAVGMLASNVLERELLELRSGSGNLSASASASGFAGPGETGAWRPLEAALLAGAHLEAEPEEGACPLPAHAADRPGAHEGQRGAPDAALRAALRASVEQRVARGELVDWSPGEQGLVFAAGPLGNLLIAIPLTRLGELHGTKWVILVAVLGASIQAAFTPLLAPLRIWLIVAFQLVFSGLTYGLDCCVYTLFAHWLTPTEIAFFISCLLICYQLGNILSSSITATILAHRLPWSLCFYAPALLCALWALGWTLLGASEPAASRLITRRELAYLARRTKIARVMHANRDELNESAKLARGEPLEDPVQARARAVSWPKLAADPNIWAIIAVKFTLRWYFSAYASLMPTFLSSVAHMSVETIGRVSVLQSLVCLVSGLFLSYATKSLVSRRPFNLSLATYRKIFQSVVNFGLALSLLLFISFDCSAPITIVSLTLSGIFLNFYVAAAPQLPLDLSPDYCGLITSISNTLALGQTLGAPISGLILNGGSKDRKLWRLVWALVVVLNTLSGVLFILMVDSRPRDYSKGAPLHSPALARKTAPRARRASS